MAVLRIVVALLALPLVGAAFAALVGLGVVRGLDGAHVAVVSCLLTLLPILGVRTLLGNHAWATVAGMWTWPMLVLAGLPGYFPGEIDGAIATGLAVIAAPGGSEAATQAARFADAVTKGIEKVPEGEKPAPQAERVRDECPPCATLEGDAVSLPYEGRGHSMVVPVDFGGVELPMLFDTGATLTTLDSASLRKLGVRVPADAPQITMRTAAGERTAQIVVLDKVWVGGMPVEGVTIGVCEECADQKTAGLLGLNVSGQFLVTVDTVGKEVIFQARRGQAERLLDVSPWVRISASARVYPDTRVEVEVRGISTAPRTVQEATVGIACADDRFTARLTNLRADAPSISLVNLPRGTNCDAYKVSLEHARW